MRLKNDTVMYEKQQQYQSHTTLPGGCFCRDLAKHNERKLGWGKSPHKQHISGAADPTSPPAQDFSVFQKRHIFNVGANKRNLCDLPVEHAGIQGLFSYWKFGLLAEFAAFSSLTVACRFTFAQLCLHFLLAYGGHCLTFKMASLTGFALVHYPYFAKRQGLGIVSS